MIIDHNVRAEKDKRYIQPTTTQLPQLTGWVKGQAGQAGLPSQASQAAGRASKADRGRLRSAAEVHSYPGSSASSLVA